jgi:hypothetical protein
LDKVAKMAEADALGKKLFSLANEFALAGEGDVAVLLHTACNNISRADSQLKGEFPKRKMDAIVRTEMLVNSLLF